MSKPNDPCFCGSGLKTKKCHRDIDANSAFARLITLYNGVDAQIAKNTGNIRCRKGCSSCCHEHFNISPVEFYFIMYSIYLRDGMDKVHELIDKGYKFWTEFESMYPEDAKNLRKNLTGSTNIDQNTIRTFSGIADDFKRISDTPCMFLNEETKSCSIYDFRPLVCRTYGVGYTTKIDVPFMMCEHIQDGLEYQNEMADLTSFRNAEAELTAVLVKELESVVIERNYPIFYFLKIQKDMIEVMLRKIDEYRSFSLQKILYMKSKRITNL